MGPNRQVLGLLFALAVLSSAGCTHTRPAIDPPKGLPPLDLGRDTFDSSSAGRPVTLDPPRDAVPPSPPAPEWPTQPQANKTPAPPAPVWPTQPQANKFPAPEPPDPEPRTFRPTEKIATTAVAPAKLLVGIEGARAVSPGDPIALEVHVSNAGAALATNVKLRADVDAALVHESSVRSLEVEIGSLAPGQSKMAPLMLTAAQTGKPAVHVTATGDGDLHAEAVRAIAVVQRAMQFSLSGPPTRYVNRPGAWDVKVANSGEAPLTKVTARVRIPRELRFQSATGNGKFTAGEVVWDIGDLRPGERRELQVTAIPVAGAGEATLTGLAAADKVTAQSAEVAFEVMGMPVLRAEIVPPTEGVPAGGKGIVAVRVTNQGTLAARNVSVAAVAGQPWLAPRFGTGPTIGHVQGDRVEFAPVARIEPEQTVTFQIEVAGGQPGDGRMRVEVRSETTPTPLMVEEAIRVRLPAAPGRLAPTP
jgi:hypothetical protein